MRSVMMADMGNHRSGRRGAGWAASVAGVALGAGLVAGCFGDSGTPPKPEPTTAAPMALRIETVYGAERMSERARTDLEAAVGDVLSEYLVRAFLGRNPREDFVRAFSSFTPRAAASGATDLDLLTAAPLRRASSVRATRLGARLSVMAAGRDVLGATAHIRFGFEAEVAGEESRRFDLSGRLLLLENEGRWRVFGYDVARREPARRGGASS